MVQTKKIQNSKDNCKEVKDIIFSKDNRIGVNENILVKDNRMEVKENIFSKDSYIEGKENPFDNKDILFGSTDNHSKNKDILFGGMDSKTIEKMENAFNKILKKHDSGKLTLDTIGADYYFILNFVNEEMLGDFSRIEEDFLNHCYDKLRKFAGVKSYDYIEARYLNPNELHRYIITSLMLNGAKARDEYCIALVKYLFKTYHKKIYKQLKRFSKISAFEVTSLCEYGDDVNMGDMGIILTMCQINGITLCNNCEVLFKLLNQRKEDLDSENEKQDEKNVFSSEDFDEATEIVEKWIQEDEKGKPKYHRQDRVYRKEIKFVEECFRYFNFPEDYIHDSRENDMGQTVQYTRALSVLRKAYPKREFTFEELQRYTVLFDTISALVNISKELNDVYYLLLGLNKEDSGLEGETLFNPENIVVNKTEAAEIKEEKVLTNIVVPESDEGTEEDYLAEINELKKKLSQKENECKHLRMQYATMNVERKEMESVLAKYQNDREELIALREFVYNQDQTEPDFKTKTVEEMKQEIEGKNYVIIGGHINWINKLRSEFPNWTYISVDNFKNFDGAVLGNKEMIFFFTDYISHTAYG